MTNEEKQQRTSRGETYGELLRRAHEEWQPAPVVEAEEKIGGVIGTATQNPQAIDETIENGRALLGDVDDPEIAAAVKRKRTNPSLVRRKPRALRPPVRQIK